MMEAKGNKGKLEKLNKDGEIIGITYFEKDSGTHKAGDPNYFAVQQYAVNGALHYGSAILDGGDYTEVIIVGLNGSQLDKNGDVVDAEFKAYYVSEKNNRVPKLIKRLDAYMKLFKQMNIDKLYKELDTLNLSDEEQEKIRSKAAHTGLFSYMNNFYAKDADVLNISLPIALDVDGTPLIEMGDGKSTYHDDGYIPDWEYMEKYIRVIEKR